MSARNERNEIQHRVDRMVLCVVGFGFYRGWFSLTTSSPEPGNNKVNINLAVDPDKAKADVKSATDKTTGAADSAPIDDNTQQP